MIDKELFTEVIEDAKKSDDYQKWLNKQLKKNGVDGYIFQPNCVDDVIKLLHACFGEADAKDVISYFCFELDYGRKWEPGMWIENETDVELSTPAHLYSYLSESSLQKPCASL
ncbi:MAG: hypothetical protein HFE84_09730 [Lachnospiraceae bacterium]|nr:hypothetical protein [Lachnospiraceae bacterium]